MSDILLQPGDGFATANPQSLGKAITFIEALKANSITAEYSHAGIIQDAHGKTLEAVWHIEEQNIFDAYKGQKVIIFRWTLMTPEAYQKGFDAVKDEIGMTYPYYRLVLHVIGLAKFIHLGKDTVCSELYEKFILNAGAIMTEGKNWWGITPQGIVDEVRISRYFDVIFEGIL
jgi:hypothetical protein